MKTNWKTLLRYLPLALWLLILAANTANVCLNGSYWAAKPPSDYTAQMQFETRLAFLLTLIVFSCPLGTAAVFLLSWLPEWLLPQHAMPDNLYLAIAASVSTLGFYAQWYILLPRLLRRWKNRRDKAA